MVHHVALGAEALTAILWAVEGAMVVVHAHVHRKVVPVVKGLATGRDRAHIICSRHMVCHVRPEVLLRVEFFLTLAMSALKHLVALLQVLAHLVRVKALHRPDET
jgi:hypothetical protein